jgi:hypothetical protein
MIAEATTLGQLARSKCWPIPLSNLAPPCRSDLCHLDDRNRFATTVIIVEEAQLEAVTFVIQLDHRQLF